MLPRSLVFTYAGLFGALFGSFLNVVVVRLPRGESIVSPGSHCMACGKPVRWFDNLPVVSWLWLRGRCRHCGARFSPAYAIVEAAMAGAGVLSAWMFGPTLQGLEAFVLLWLLAAISLIDLDHWIIPHELSWPGIGLGLLFSAFNPRVGLRASVTAAAIAWGVFTVLSYLGEKAFKKEALGWGDRWLFAMEAAFLGPGALLPIILFATFQGSVIGGLLIVIGKNQTGEAPPKPAAAAAPELAVETAPKVATPVVAARDADGPALTDLDDADDDWVPPKNAIPFGPFLALAAVEWLVFGPQLSHWYVERFIRPLL